MIEQFRCYPGSSLNGTFLANDFFKIREQLFNFLATFQHFIEQIFHNLLAQSAKAKSEPINSCFAKSHF